MMVKTDSVELMVLRGNSPIKMTGVPVGKFEKNP